jgi:preprotein translocase subunit SecF
MFRGIKFLPSDLHLDYVGKRFIALGLSIFMLIGSAALVGVKGLNFGIDFTGGIQMEVRGPQAVDIGDLRSRLNGLGIGDIELQGIGDTGREVMIRIPAFDSEVAQNAALKQVREAMGPGSRIVVPRWSVPRSARS